MRSRRGGAWPAVVAAVALHAACLGALLGLQNIRTAQPAPQEAIVEFAVRPALEPSPTLPEPAASDPATLGPAAPAVAEAVALPPPEPAETAAMTPEISQPLAEAGPAPAETPPPLPPAAPEQTAAAMPPAVDTAPAPVLMELTPRRPHSAPPQPQPIRPQPRPHAAAPRTAGARQDSAANGTSVNLAAATPAVSVPRAADQQATLEARIRDAVQAAVHYPASARMMGITGRARVLLDYRSGGVGGPALTQSSGTPMLDEAALAAARTAHYPPAPAEIEGRLLRLLVWVEFKPG